MARQPKPVKWFAAVLFSDPMLLENLLERLATRLSAIDLRSPAFAFDYTDYYQAEMGANLKRVLVSFSALAPPDRLADIKIFCADLEKTFSQAGNRSLNIDPGYLDLFKVVLASFKGRENKIYVGEGVWADLTLYYQGGRYHPLPWTFPDFRTEAYHGILRQIRERYKQDLAPYR